MGAHLFSPDHTRALSRSALRRLALGLAYAPFAFLILGCLTTLTVGHRPAFSPGGRYLAFVEHPRLDPWEEEVEPTEDDIRILTERRHVLRTIELQGGAQVFAREAYGLSDPVFDDHGRLFWIEWFQVDGLSIWIRLVRRDLESQTNREFAEVRIDFPAEARESFELPDAPPELREVGRAMIGCLVEPVVHLTSDGQHALLSGPCPADALIRWNLRSGRAERLELPGLSATPGPSDDELFVLVLPNEPAPDGLEWKEVSRATLRYRDIDALEEELEDLRLVRWIPARTEKTGGTLEVARDWPSAFHRPLVSENGRFVSAQSFLTAEGNGFPLHLFELEASGDNPPTSVQLSESASGATFDASGRLVWLESGERGSRVLARDPGSGETRTIVEAVLPPRCSGLSLDADARTLCIRLGKSSASIPWIFHMESGRGEPIVSNALDAYQMLFDWVSLIEGRPGVKSRNLIASVLQAADERRDELASPFLERAQELRRALVTELDR